LAYRFLEATVEVKAQLLELARRYTGLQEGDGTDLLSRHERVHLLDVALRSRDPAGLTFLQDVLEGEIGLRLHRSDRDGDLRHLISEADLFDTALVVRQHGDLGFELSLQDPEMEATLAVPVTSDQSADMLRMAYVQSEQLRCAAHVTLASAPRDRKGNLALPRQMLGRVLSDLASADTLGAGQMATTLRAMAPFADVVPRGRARRVDVVAGLIDWEMQECPVPVRRRRLDAPSREELLTPLPPEQSGSRP
jgi:hypothetical protein